MTQYTDWKIWNGGFDCPVDPEKKVQVQWRNETRIEVEKNTIWQAKEINWRYSSHCPNNDIIAYREVIEPEKETQAYWALQGHPLRAFNKVMCPPDGACVIFLTFHYEDGEVVHVEVDL